MKIVKSFKPDKKFLHMKGFTWALADNGKLYYFYEGSRNDGLCSSYLTSCPSLEEMQVIIKEFGHLLVFI